MHLRKTIIIILEKWIEIFYSKHKQCKTVKFIITILKMGGHELFYKRATFIVKILIVTWFKSGSHELHNHRVDFMKYFIIFWKLYFLNPLRNILNVGFHFNFYKKYSRVKLSFNYVK